MINFPRQFDGPRLAGGAPSTLTGRLDANAVQHLPSVLNRSAAGYGLRVALTTASLLVLTPAAALAQEVPSEAARPIVTQPDEAATVDEIIVTGSRITRRDFAATSPIVTTTAEALQASGSTTLGEALMQLPQVSASAGAARVGNGGRTNVNLRGLGSARNLVLLDGRRLQPSDAYNAVDLNTIPAALIDSVELITGGASAVYGSDALSGVVNLKLKRDFTGVEFDAQYGLTEHGDGESTDLSIAGGSSYDGGKGSALFALSYTDRMPMFQRHRFDFFSNQPSVVTTTGFITADGNNLPSQGGIDAIFADYGVAPGAAPRSTALLFNPDGTLVASAGGANLRPFPGRDFTVFGNRATENFPADFQSFSQPLTRYSAFANTSYEINDSLRVYGQFNYTTYDADNYQLGDYAVTRYGLRVPITNPFVPRDLGRYLAARPDPTAPFLYNGITSSIATAIEENHYEVWQMLAGVAGRIPGTSWTWDVYGSRGNTGWQQTFANGISYTALRALVNASDGGASLCQGGLNLFPLRPGGVSEACKTFLLRDYRNQTDLEQQVVEANLQGALFNLPAGEARFALGAGYRRNSFDFQPDVALRPDPVTGLPEALLTNFQRETLPVEGESIANELYAEVLIPLLKDIPGISELNLGAAYRYSEYNTVGGVNTYKVDLDWAVVPQIRFRAGYQRAVRAPSVGELFAPPSTIVGTIGNPNEGAGDGCDTRSVYRRGPNASQVRAICLAQGVPASVIDTYQWPVPTIQTQIAGDRNLGEETGDSITAGAVWRPEFSNPLLSNLSLSFDYYRIEIADAMGVINASAVYQACFNGTGTNPTYDPNNVDCRRIARAPDGTPRLTVTPLVNLGAYETSGVDFQADWKVTPADLSYMAGVPGELSLNLVMSYVDKYAIQNTPTSPFLDFAGTIGNGQIDATTISHPKWKSLATITYDLGAFQIGTRLRYTSAMSNSINVGTSAAVPGVDAVTYSDVFGSWDITEAVVLRAGITNVADKDPPQWTGFGATDRTVFDIAGRSYYMGVTSKF